MYKTYFKRVFDLSFALALIVLLIIPMFVVALITVCDSPGPILFRQLRCGKKKKPFYILKFRSMPLTTPKHVPSNELSDIKLTGWQSVLRKYSLDEIPQILNILWGDMSFVGPRPVIFDEFELINERDKYAANDVRPGLTGLAQIMGRDELDYVHKAKLDGDYVNELHFLMDTKCLIGTINCVLTHKGYHEISTNH